MIIFRLNNDKIKNTGGVKNGKNKYKQFESGRVRG